MGNSTSKVSRTLNSNVKPNVQPLNHLKKKVTEDHLKLSNKNELKRLNNTTENKTKEDEHQIFTSRPPKELEKMGDNDLASGKNTLFEQAVKMGVVNIKDDMANQAYNPNHESIQVLKNRADVEKQYEGLFIPKDADQPNIPERFLDEEQKKLMLDPEILKQKMKRSGTNSYGLFDSSTVSDFLIDYKIYGKDRLLNQAEKFGINNSNIEKFQQFIDNGILNLPTHKVTLHQTVDPESKQVKQKLIVVKDDWVKEVKENIEREKNHELALKSSSTKDQEVFEQFKMLEKLVSKSQILTKKSDGPTETTETVMKRPKKKLIKEVTTMV